MEDEEVLARIRRLVEDEKELRGRPHPLGLTETEREKLKRIETQLDQCWDLLRRRQAREEFGQDPDLEHEMPESIVEGYEQ